MTPYMKRIIHQPTLMVTSWYDDITMTEFEVPAFHTIPSPRKKLVQIGEGASHMSLYDNPDHLRIVGEACTAFAGEYKPDDDLSVDFRQRDPDEPDRASRERHAVAQ